MTIGEKIDQAILYAHQNYPNAALATETAAKCALFMGKKIYVHVESPVALLNAATTVTCFLPMYDYLKHTHSGWDDVKEGLQEWAGFGCFIATMCTLATVGVRMSAEALNNKAVAYFNLQQDYLSKPFISYFMPQAL